MIIYKQNTIKSIFSKLQFLLLDKEHFLLISEKFIAKKG